LTEVQSAIQHIPLELLLLPASFPVHFFSFAGFARVHLAPVLLLMDRQFALKTDLSPDLSDLDSDGPDSIDFSRFKSPRSHPLLNAIKTCIGKLAGIPGHLHNLAAKRAEKYMLERIEPDGTLYSYASCTFLMIFALLALGYDKQHPVITHAIAGLKSMLCHKGGEVFLQNSPSAVWDTALVSHALQEAGTGTGSKTIRDAASYLLSKQQRKFGDWKIHVKNPVSGGWGFSDSNTIHPDVDDTTAALRAIKRFSPIEPSYSEAWNRGLYWILSMQNDDGGWPAFERNTDSKLLALIPMDGTLKLAFDSSTVDLTGRTLEFLGNTAGLGIRHKFIRRGADWLVGHQEKDGSWYGRWGVCYIYGTWAALTGMMAVGIDSEHPAVRSGVRWLLSIQNPDGGWGESCQSDRLKRYVPLGTSTLSQTAWALDALIAAYSNPVPEIERGVKNLIASLYTDDWTTSYPTGAGLPGKFYIHYHSYRYIWPLLALSHYTKKFGG
jgi:sporulenol synthase